MSNINIIEGEFTAKGKRFCLVVARFNSFVVESLLEGALGALGRHGADESDLTIVRVPGAYEIPLAVKVAAEQNKFDAIIALGAVIRGGTPHFEYVAGECVRGMSDVMMSDNIPVIFGVLTVDTVEQALERAGTDDGNKGGEAAMSAIEMVNVIEKLRG